METEIQENQYQIKTTGFEGPFGLLLRLVEERKLFINDVSLAQVTDSYIQYVNSVKNLHPAEISSFIVVAATLILIKSKSLLPNLNLTSEEESDIKNLEERLRLYELYSRLSQSLKILGGKNMIFLPNERKSDLLVFLPDNQITKESMMTFAKGALGRIPQKIFLQEVEVKKVISIEEMIDKLTERIQNSMRFNFKDFAGKSVTREDKVVVIVGFLAMLEMARQGILNVIQEGNFDEIYIEKFIPSQDEEETLIIENI